MATGTVNSAIDLRRITWLIVFLLLVAHSFSQAHKKQTVPKQKVPKQTETSPTESRQSEIKPGEIWNDTKGNPINAHGGGILYDLGRWYWFGEIKKGKTWRVPGVDSWEDYRGRSRRHQLLFFKRPGKLEI